MIVLNTVQPIRNIDDIERMKEVLPHRDRLMFIIGINTALRISDILPLKVSDISDDYLRVKEQKTGKFKRIRINDSIRQAFAEYYSHITSADDFASDAFLFPSRKGYSHIGRVQAWRILSKAAERIGIDSEIGTHSLRKTFGFHAYTNGVALPLLMRVLNHSSERETLRYIGIESDQVDDVYVDLCL